MNDENIRNNIPEEEIPVTEAEEIAPAEEIEASEEQTVEEAVFEEIPAAEVKEQPVPENPVYTQQPYTGTSGYGYNQSYGYPPPSYGRANPTPVYTASTAPVPEKKKDRKGLKIFAACLALVIVFALGFGVASIRKDNNGGSISSSDRGKNTDGPQLNINESPVTPTADRKSVV